MHCPRCGADALAGQPFCRSCGFNLEKVAELLAEQPPAALDANLAHVHLRQSRLEHWAGVAGLALMSLVLVSLIYLVISEMIIKSGKIGLGLFFLILFIGGAFVAGLQGYSKSLKERLTNQQAVKNLLHTGATKELDPHREPANSVTEHTTELLSANPVQHRANTKEV